MTKFPQLSLDSYTRRARLKPVLLVALPIGLATLAWFPSGAEGQGLLWGLVTWSGGGFLLSQIGRDAGKRREPKLFAQWGGTPSTRLLRHAGTTNPVVLVRRHRALQVLMPDVKLPSTPTAEARDRRGADAAYEACVLFLRERTRDRNEFPLIFEENCSYGFRRNLWGLRPWGLALAMLAFVAIELQLRWRLYQGQGVSPVVIGCGVVTGLLLLGWAFLFTPGWVRVAAEAYAERLLSACDSSTLKAAPETPRAP